MGWITCPKHPDCSIECDGPGFANFREPYGPCVKRCHPEKFASALNEQFSEAELYAHFTGLIVEMPGKSLGDFAHLFGPCVPREAERSLQVIGTLGSRLAATRFSTAWRKQSVVEVIETLAAAMRSALRPRQAGHKG